ncbi:MAG: ATP-binding protein [Vicinamibacterales bacterium]
MSIRTAMALIMTGLAGMAAAAATSLIVITSRFDAEATSLAAAADGIRTAQSLEITLLRHARIATGPQTGRGDLASVRAVLESSLTRLLNEAAAIAGRPQERALVENARASVELYVAARDPATASGRLEGALESLSDFVSLNIAEADQAKHDAARLNREGDLLGAIVALLLIAVTAITLTWLHVGVFRPLFRLRTAIQEFGDAPERRMPSGGPAEVAAIADAFNHMADRLDAQRQRQLTFIAAVVHDLRNPMAPLKMAADRLAHGQAGARVEQLGAMIMRQVAQLERLASDLLDSARIEAGELELRPETCDLRDTIAHVVELFRAQPDGERVSANFPEAPIAVECDPERLQQVVGNLISNALKYSPDGGYVEVTLAADNDQAKLRVTDQGVGIAEADLPYIFEPFRRVGNAAHSVPGVGLGLSITRRIVRAHGGRIDVKSAPGVGSTFTVVLPKASGTAHA